MEAISALDIQTEISRGSKKKKGYSQETLIFEIYVNICRICFDK